MGKTKTKEKAEEYNQLRRQYSGGKIDQEEFEEKLEQLSEDGLDFLEYEDTAADVARDAKTSLMQKLSYYSLPLFVLLPPVVVLLLPNVSIFVLIYTWPTLVIIGLLLYYIFT